VIWVKMGVRVEEGNREGSCKQGMVGVGEKSIEESGSETWGCRYRFKYALGLPREASEQAEIRQRV
jgi:hypothetical protein